jgi:hypothetical protein
MNQKVGYIFMVWSTERLMRVHNLPTQFLHKGDQCQWEMCHREETLWGCPAQFLVRSTGGHHCQVFLLLVVCTHSLLIPMQWSLWEVGSAPFRPLAGSPLSLNPPCLSPLLGASFYPESPRTWSCCTSASPSMSFSGRPLTAHTWEITSNCPVLIPVPPAVLAWSVHLHGAEQKE